MIDWFDKVFNRRNYPKDERTDMEKIGDDMSKVIPFPEPKAVPEPTQCRTEQPAKVYYRLGLTDNNRVSFQMGYSEILMNQAGVDNLIQQLQVFRDQLTPEEDE